MTQTGWLPFELSIWNSNILVPFAQQGGNQVPFYQRFSEAFRQGIDPSPVYIGIIVLFIALLGAYWLLRLISYLGTPASKERKKYSILDSIQSNLKLSDRQSRYLRALIEKFKDRSSYEPEVSTDYLKDFLFFAMQNLSHAPKRSIRRKTHYVPDFKPDHNIDIMLQVDEDTYTTIQADIIEQNDEKVTVTTPYGNYSDELTEGRTLHVAYKKGELTLRGEAQITSVDDEQMILNLKRGMHFEEQRTYERIDIEQTPCQLILQEWEGKTLRYEGFVTNLSVGGAQVTMEDSDQRIDRNMRGRMQFQLGTSLEMDLEVVVIHAEMEEKPFTLGLEFINPGMENRNSLHEFIQRKQSQDEHAQSA